MLERKPLILIVDDNELNREMTGVILEDMGACPDYADCGQVAIDKCKELNHEYTIDGITASVSSYDAILMDYMMPEMDGAETTRNIRDLDKCDKIPVIAMTAEEDPMIVQILLSSGMNAILHKPINPSALAGVLSEYVDAEFTVQQDDTESADMQEDDDFSKRAIGLKKLGFDIGSGIRFTGNKNRYEKYLYDMIKLLPGILETLNETEKDGDVERFTIEIHGLKSNFRALGQSDLFSRSQELEKLGKSRDTESISQKYPSFYTDCQKCLEGLLSMVAPKEQLPALSFDSLKRVLSELRDACETFDLDTADYINERLSSHIAPENMKDDFKRLFNEIANIRYDKAVEVIDALVKKCGEKNNG